ncbi:glycoside hydrolase family 19 protein [Afifella pfennigii]|uniref:glycoside hydrolase family 19 protein n=1 Tax=Afifella pfennigii TaxID=209897 RepID=UPI0006904062|nr:glycoside hydrolase family 19 protein [Afifella pfennigii]
MIAVEELRAIVGKAARADILKGLAEGLAAYGAQFGLHRPEALAQFLAQIAHESGRFRHLEEVWGPSAAQRRYDTRTDLGNTAAPDGDGYLYRGRGLIQLTGAGNARAFSAWAGKRFAGAPDFLAEPQKLAAFPWALLSALFFWEANGLGRFAVKGDLTAITSAVNGGLNGLSERRHLYVRAALTLLGYRLERGVLARFQKERGLVADDIAGPATRAALHAALSELPVLKPGAAGEEAAKEVRRIVGLPAELVLVLALALAALAAAMFLPEGGLP